MVRTNEEFRNEIQYTEVLSTMPLFTLEKIGESEPVPLKRGAKEIKPVYLRMKEIVLASAKIVVDETRAPVLDPGRGRTKTGYFWAISRDDRPWGGLDPPAVVYTYSPGRGGEHCTALLACSTGIVHCDGYTVY